MNRELLRRSAWIVALAALTVRCSDDKPPTSPTTTTSSTPAGPKAIAIAIGGLRSPLVVGESLQLTATLSYSDGSTRDVTPEARWSTGSGAATVTADGLLTAVRPGFCDVNAAYLPAGIGTISEFIVNPAPPPVPEIRGIVHEATPRPGLALAGVRVEISDGPYAGQATTTDYDGYFQFFGIQQAGFDLVASKRGYDTTRYRIAELPRDRTPDILLPGPFSAPTERVTGTFAPDCLNPTAVLTRSIFFTPRRDGVFTVDWRVNTEEVGVSVWIGATGIVPDRSFQPSQYSVVGGTRYELKVIANVCRPVPPIDGSYQIDLSYPL